MKNRAVLAMAATALTVITLFAACGGLDLRGSQICGASDGDPVICPAGFICENGTCISPKKVELIKTEPSDEKSNEQNIDEMNKSEPIAENSDGGIHDTTQERIPEPDPDTSEPDIPDKPTCQQLLTTMPSKCKVKNANGPCAIGKYECVNGKIECVQITQPETEVCNGLDDDCDGQTDEELGMLSCGANSCASTIPKCSNGTIQKCEPKRAAKPEECNGIDDDCDGMTDEDLGTLNCGTGPCANSVLKCVNGQVQTCTPKPGSAEICDGVDNDCNGKIDDVASTKLASDINNCGACGNSCKTAANASAACSSGACGITCNQDWRNADSIDSNGCEAKHGPGVNPLDSSIIMYHNFSKQTGKPLSSLDLSQNRLDGVISGATHSNSGVVGGSICFNGDHKITIKNNPLFQKIKTISLWVKPGKIARRNSPLWINDDSPVFTMASSQQWQIIFGPNSGAPEIAGSQIALSKWHLLTTVFNTNNVCLYENGSQVKCVAATPSIGSEIYLGQDPGGSTRRFNGCIDELIASNTPWSAAQIKKYYLTSKP